MYAMPNAPLTTAATASTSVRRKTGSGHTLLSASGSPRPSGMASLAHGGMSASTVAVRATRAKPSAAAASSAISWERPSGPTKRRCDSFTRRKVAAIATAYVSPWSDFEVQPVVRCAEATPCRTLCNVIELKHLTKRYGATLAVDDLSFSVRPGLVTGFLGPNGAGKSTTMRLILGLCAPTSGEALVNGRRYASLRRPV